MSPSYLRLSTYGANSFSIHPNLSVLRLTGISFAFNETTSAIYETRSFAFSELTSIPLSESCIIFDLFATTLLSIVFEKC